MGESHRLLDLEERGQGYGCAAQAREDRVAHESPLLNFDIEVNGKGGVLDYW